jgi:hypothetical protein
VIYCSWDTAGRKIKQRRSVKGREEVSMGYEGRRNEEKTILRVRERELLKERDNERQKQGEKVTEYRGEKGRRKRRRKREMKEDNIM